MFSEYVIEDMSKTIWYEDLTQFITVDTYYQVLPLGDMSLEEKLNALLRFFLYLSIILALLLKNAKYLFMGLVPAILSIVFYQFERRDREYAENFLKNRDLDIVDNQLCTRTTIDNPFMNPSIVDIQYNSERPAACDLDKVKDKVNDNFKQRVYKDVNDLWGTSYSAREFYTVPSTTIPNDQDGFAKWLYGSGPTCKEGNGLECQQNMYRPIMR